MARRTVMVLVVAIAGALFLGVLASIGAAGTEQGHRLEVERPDQLPGSAVARHLDAALSSQDRRERRGDRLQADVLESRGNRHAGAHPLRAAERQRRDHRVAVRDGDEHVAGRFHPGVSLGRRFGDRDDHAGGRCPERGGDCPGDRGRRVRGARRRDQGRLHVRERPLVDRRAGGEIRAQIKATGRWRRRAVTASGVRPRLV